MSGRQREATGIRQQQTTEAALRTIGEKGIQGTQLPGLPRRSAFRRATSTGISEARERSSGRYRITSAKTSSGFTMQSGAVPDSKDLDTISVSLEKLIRELDEVGEAVHAIRRLAHDYTPPSDACNTYLVTYQKLQEFEDDLYKHVHLENNSLFPKAKRRKDTELFTRHEEHTVPWPNHRVF